MQYRKILISLPEETIKLLDLYRYLKGISRTKKIRTLIEQRLNDSKSDFNQEKNNLSHKFTSHAN